MYPSLSSPFDTFVTFLPPKSLETVSRPKQVIFLPKCLDSGLVYLSTTTETDVFLCWELPRWITPKCLLFRDAAGI